MGASASTPKHSLGWWLWLASLGLLGVLVMLQIVWFVTMNSQNRSDAIEHGQHIEWHIANKTLIGSPLTLKHSSDTPAAEPTSAPPPQQAAPEPTAPTNDPIATQPSTAPDQPQINATPPATSNDNVPAHTNAKQLPAWMKHATATSLKPDKDTIAIIITGLGLSRSTTQAAMRLPSEVSLSFSAYAHDIRSWAEQAKGRGADIYLELPMEPIDFPLTDPGPKALLTSLSQTQLRDRLHWVLDRYPAAVGVLGAIEEKFTNDPESAANLLQDITAEGKLFYSMRTDDTSLLEKTLTSLDALNLKPAILMDKEIDEESMRLALEEAATLAKQEGYAIVVARPYPISIRQLEAWLKGVHFKNIQIAPLSTIALQEWRYMRDIKNLNQSANAAP